MADAGRKLLASELEGLLVEFNKQLEISNKVVRLAVCGGVVMVLSGSRERTSDIDGLFKSGGEDLANEIHDTAVKFELDDGWLNTEVNDIFSLLNVPESEFEPFRKYSNLEVIRVSDKIMLSMKVCAARERADRPDLPGKNDLPDTVTLLRRMKLLTFNEVMKVLNEVREITMRNTRIGKVYTVEYDARNIEFLKKALKQAKKSADKI